MRATESTIPAASFWDNVAFTFHYAIPILLQGSLTRRRFWVGFFSRMQRGPRAVDFISRLRKKLGSDYLWIRLGSTRSLLVLDPQGISRILDRSPEIYADPAPKRDGMRLFQPGAVTISRGDEWNDRRRFNETVLDSKATVHRLASSFLQVVRAAIDPDEGPAPKYETWNDFDGLFAAITRQVVFGQTARTDTAITDLLHNLMCEANRRRKPAKSKYFDEFYGRVQEYLDKVDANSLAGLYRDAPQTETTRVANQVPHWMFAMWETLGANTLRALALILAHPQVEKDVRQEMAANDLTTPDGIDRLKLLEGCVQEAMRLWPTTPILLRETVADDQLGGQTIERGSQVLILNSFNHRDRERYELADTFAPHRWIEGSPHPLFLHFSSGTQVCAGKSLALFIAKAVLATLLNCRQYKLLKPSLEPARSLPHAYNYFRVRFSCA